VRVGHDDLTEAETSSRQQFWTGYQPGFRASGAEPGSPEFYAEVERHRYELEPAILELARFEEWRDRDVLECGCGIATDGMRFLRAGARYTGMDFSPTAIGLASARAEAEGHDQARFVAGSITDLPFEDGSFDLCYSNGVIHHAPQTQRIVDEMHRVLRPGGQALVMVYHRNSFNYFFSIMVLRRLLASALLIPGAVGGIARLTGEAPAVLEGHRALLREHGLAYLTDAGRFLSHNTDGPGNPLSKVYSRRTGARLFGAFSRVETEVRFLNLRAYPRGERLERTAWARRLGERAGWHLWIRATK
jgi:SAM-dependent methyltransferase